MSQGNNKKLLTKKIRKGDKGYPIATIAFYGPNNIKASKVVCAIIPHDGAEAGPIKKWFSISDIRKSEKTMGEILIFIEENHANTVGMMDGIIGCPHEEGIDYPIGEFCPECEYWSGRDRFSHARIH
ncbi:hypothetical protein [Teredinibacter franksiae]|uniref:hypothetical protein n=1 Tax=Teredinibacter franksiae TaxID=2761453 RepID=UPI00162970E9|nr:hypothetical protein [Teredinibacter franksiae]